MDEAQLISLLSASAALAVQVTALIPKLVANFEAIKAGLASDNADDLSAQIAAMHDQVQALDAKLQAMKSG